MSTAVIGLIGVIVGAAISGAAGFLLAARAESRQSRMSARLLENELLTIVGALAVRLRWRHLGVGSATMLLARREVHGLVGEFPDTHLWEEHRAILAATLSVADWYAVAGAYQRVAEMRAEVAGYEPPDTPPEPSGLRLLVHGVEQGLKLDLMLRDVAAGARALSRRAGRYSESPQLHAVNELLARGPMKDDLPKVRRS